MPRVNAGEKTIQSRKATGAKIERSNANAGPSGKAGSGLGRNRLSMVRALIEKWSAELQLKTTKSGVAELIRLLALEREMAASNQIIREIKVTWVEPKTTELSKSE